MAGGKKRNRKYVPKRFSPKLSSNPVLVSYIMAPIDDMISELETRGTLSVSEKGEAVFSDMLYGETYNLVPAARGFLDVFGVIEKRKGISIGLEPVRQLINRIHYLSPVTQRELDAAKAGVERMRAALRLLSVAEADDIVVTTLIKQENEREKKHDDI